MIKKAGESESRKVAELAALLWPSHSVEPLMEEMKTYIMGASSAIFLAYEQDEEVGFAQCQIRVDYVEGTDSSPVGYLEGIYVKENYRGQGIAKQLLKTCEDWARTTGCQEFASDCELSNTESFKFHMHTEFKEANRIVCFVKKL